MNEILFQYHRINLATWIYLSSLLTIGLYFKFSRLWSVRNLDLVGLILLAPGLLLVVYGQARRGVGLEQGVVLEQAGYIWLFATSGIFMVRLLLDPMMTRRPLLEPNLSVGGMTFIGVSLLLFLMVNVVNSKVITGDTSAVDGADAATPRATHAPGLPLLYSVPRITTQLVFPDSKDESGRADSEKRNVAAEVTARTLAVLSHLAIVVGMVLIGSRHFNNIKTGIAAALLFLLLPYTAHMSGQVDHLLPAALLIWGLQMYRRPMISGILMGLAIGALTYPVFLLPLWLGFYWHRGLLRFSLGVGLTVGILVTLLFFLTGDFRSQIAQMFDWSVKDESFWGLNFIDKAYRTPVLAAYFALCASLALWPAQKNLGTLMSCSAAVMLGTQFWHGDQGGLYMAWYLPLMLLTIFRPNLEDRVALSVLGEGWFPKRRHALGDVEKAA